MICYSRGNARPLGGKLSAWVSLSVNVFFVLFLENLRLNYDCRELSGVLKHAFRLRIHSPSLCIP